MNMKANIMGQNTLVTGMHDPDPILHPTSMITMLEIMFNMETDS